MRKEIMDNLTEKNVSLGKLLLEHIKMAAKAQIISDGAYAVGYRGAYATAASFSKNIENEYGLDVLEVTGDSDEFRIKIRCEGYLCEAMDDLGCMYEFDLRVNNNNGDAWYVFEDEEEVDDTFWAVELNIGVEHALKFDSIDSYLDGMRKAIFMQGLRS